MRKFTLILLLFIYSNSYSQWFAQSIPTSKVVNDICFTDPLHGWLCAGGTAVSDSGIILYTSNGGTNWIKQFGAQSNPLRAIKMVNTNTGYCAGGYRTILKTTNGGNNWNNLSVDFGNYFGDLSVHNDTVYVSDYTMAPCIYRSTNGGANFTVVYGGTYCEHIFFLNGSIGWAAVGGFFLAKTTNAGNSWNTLYNFGNSNINYLFFVDENIGWSNVLDSSHLFKTVNGGINWLSQQLPEMTLGVNNIYMNSATSGWVGSGFSKILKTTDGKTWNLISVPIPSPSKPFFVDSLIGWVIGGGIAKTTNGGLTYVNGNSGIQIKNYSLKQNYPNPFNPSTIINYQLGVNSLVTLRVYDVKGNEIQTLINKQQLEGNYSVQFDGSNLPSGVYYYKLETEGFTETKKMVLLK